MRFNPLNLAKIVCFAKWVKGAKCVNIDALYSKKFVVYRKDSVVIDKRIASREAATETRMKESTQLPFLSIRSP